MWLEEAARTDPKGLCVPHQDTWFLSQRMWRITEGFYKHRSDSIRSVFEEAH